jgi:NADPH:quinone reductase-like Zn-dependent oxidoreductase
MDIGAEAVFDSTDFSKAVREASGGGVDVVFEHVGPATISESMRSLVNGGRVVTCGSTSGVKAEIPMARLFWGQMDLLGSTMGNAGEFQAVLDAIDTGLRPVVDSVYPLDEVRAALTRLDAAEQFGKVVLSLEG